MSLSRKKIIILDFSVTFVTVAAIRQNKPTTECGKSKNSGPSASVPFCRKPQNICCFFNILQFTCELSPR